ncbi:MAG: hypothetical protein JW797_20435 [Bradymonadales bacterium]|nr:hypothetical protein [Bradymonadales bacterium]
MREDSMSEVGSGVEGAGSATIAFGSQQVTIRPLWRVTNFYGSRLAMSGDDVHWASGGLHGAALWREQEQVALVDCGRVDRMFFSPDGRLLYASPHLIDREASASVELPSLQASLVAGLEARTMPHDSWFSLEAAAFSPDGAQVVVHARYRTSRTIGAEDDYQGPTQRLLLFEGNTRRLIHVLLEDRRFHRYDAVAIGERYIAGAGSRIRVWDRHTFEVVADLTEHRFDVNQLEFSPDGRFLASVAHDQKLCLWRTGTFDLVGCWVAHPHDAVSLAFHPRLALLATGGGGDEVKLWSLEDPGEQLGAIKFPQVGVVDGLAFGPSGRRLLVALHPDAGEPVVMLYELAIGP